MSCGAESFQKWALKFCTKNGKVSVCKNVVKFSEVQLEVWYKLVQFNAVWWQRGLRSKVWRHHRIRRRRICFSTQIFQKNLKPLTMISSARQTDLQMSKKVTKCTCTDIWQGLAPAQIFGKAGQGVDALTEIYRATWGCYYAHGICRESLFDKSVGGAFFFLFDYKFIARLHYFC